jgi:hypothetical protein
MDDSKIIADDNNNDDEENDSHDEKIKKCLDALIFTLLRLTSQLDDKNFTMFKYFLLAILDTTRNLKSRLKYLIKLNELLAYLQRVLSEDHVFETIGDNRDS